MNKRMLSAVVVVMAALLLSVGCLAADLVINEIAWAGTAASANDEWIELYNPTDSEVDLAGWTLLVGESPDLATIAIYLGEVEGKTVEARTLTLDPGGYLLLERTDDSTISDIAADVIYTGALSNTGVMLHLVDPSGLVVDRVDLAAWGWPGGGTGDADVPHATMERTPALTWKGNDGRVVNGLDADGNPLNGTPGQSNSAEVSWEHAPRVFIEHPQEQDLVLSGDVVVEWSATDPDAEDSALRIAISLQPSDGATASMVAEQLANAGSYAVDTTLFDDGKYVLVVTATDVDGHKGTAPSAEFEIRNAP
jgi:hypothetical protein